MLVCLPVFACLQPILIAGIALLLFVSLPLPFSLILYLVVMVFSPLISLMICAPKGRWWLLVMTANQAVVYAVIVLMMHFTLPITIFLLIVTYPVTHFYLYVFLSTMQQEVTPTVEDWGVFAWISARWTEAVTRALFGCARWTSDRCSDFLEHAEQRERERRSRFQPPSLTALPENNENRTMIV